MSLQHSSQALWYQLSKFGPAHRNGSSWLRTSALLTWPSLSFESMPFLRTTSLTDSTAGFVWKSGHCFRSRSKTTNSYTKSQVANRSLSRPSCNTSHTWQKLWRERSQNASQTYLQEKPSNVTKVSWYVNFNRNAFYNWKQLNHKIRTSSANGASPSIKVP